MIIQTSNGRVKIDPDQIAAMELETLAPMGLDHAVITLRNRRRIQCTRDEYTELALQWEQYWENDPDDDDDDEDDQDNAPLEIPETIDVTPRPGLPKRKVKSHE